MFTRHPQNSNCIERLAVACNWSRIHLAPNSLPFSQTIYLRILDLSLHLLPRSSKKLLVHSEQKPSAQPVEEPAILCFSCNLVLYVLLYQKRHRRLRHLIQKPKFYCLHRAVAWKPWIFALLSCLSSNHVPKRFNFIKASSPVRWEFSISTSMLHVVLNLASLSCLQSQDQDRGSLIFNRKI